MINATEIKIQPPWIRWLCTHEYTSGVRTIHENGKKKHAYICLKCGERKYIN